MEKKKELEEFNEKSNIRKEQILKSQNVTSLPSFSGSPLENLTDICHINWFLEK